MIGQNNNNSNNTPDKTINIYLNPSLTQNKNTNTTHLPTLDKPKILELQTTHNLKQQSTLNKMKEYKALVDDLDKIQERIYWVKLELAECDAEELESFVNLYKEKMRLNEG